MTLVRPSTFRTVDTAYEINKSAGTSCCHRSKRGDNSFFRESQSRQFDASLPRVPSHFPINALIKGWCCRLPYRKRGGGGRGNWVTRREDLLREEYKRDSDSTAAGRRHGFALAGVSLGTNRIKIP